MACNAFATVSRFIEERAMANTTPDIVVNVLQAIQNLSDSQSQLSQGMQATVTKWILDKIDEGLLFEYRQHAEDFFPTFLSDFWRRMHLKPNWPDKVLTERTKLMDAADVTRQKQKKKRLVEQLAETATSQKSAKQQRPDQNILVTDTFSNESSHTNDKELWCIDHAVSITVEHGWDGTIFDMPAELINRNLCQ